MSLESIKKNIFNKPMPDMPVNLRELWQAAYLLRRKYSNPADKDPETYFASAWSDARFISQQYGNCESAEYLMAEVYNDIERQFKKYHEKLESE